MSVSKENMEVLQKTISGVLNSIEKLNLLLSFNKNPFNKLETKHPLILQFFLNECCKRLISDYKCNNQNNLSQPFKLVLFQQEYYYLFYLSLKIIKNYYEPGSHIVSIGQSPMKLIFAQSLFYKDPSIKEAMESNNYASDLTFGYFPISGLSAFSNISKSINATTSIEIIQQLNEQLSDDKIDIYHAYFRKFGLDPENILKYGRKIIFVDRGESLATIRTFVFIYFKICKKKEYDISNFFKLIKIVVYNCRIPQDFNNYKMNESMNNRIIEINRGYQTILLEFIRILFELSDNRLPIEIIFYNIPNYMKEKVRQVHINKENSNNFSKRIRKLFYRVIPYNLITYFSYSEDISSTRCIRSVKYNNIKDILESGKFEFKNISNSKNANLSNLIIYLCFIIIKNLRSNSLLTMIEKLDNIDEEKLSLLELDSNMNENIEYTNFFEINESKLITKQFTYKLPIILKRNRNNNSLPNIKK
jgi:hypothetical protein